MLPRRGKEFYSENYRKVIELHGKGMQAAEIARQLGISYSCVYHWVKGIRKPGAGSTEQFVEYLEKNGPSPAAQLTEKFPKHSELFLTAISRKMPVKRHLLQRKFGEYRAWYYLAGQENELKRLIAELRCKYKQLREKLISSIDNSGKV